MSDAETTAPRRTSKMSATTFVGVSSAVVGLWPGRTEVRSTKEEWRGRRVVLLLVRAVGERGRDVRGVRERWEEEDWRGVKRSA